MKNTFSVLRISGLIALAIILAELTIDTGDKSVFEVYPIFWLVLGVILLLAIAIEVSVAALDKTLYMSLKPDDRAAYDAAVAVREKNRFAWFKETYDKLLDKKPIENEDEIILDHNYDGIKELDNNLPPWWLYGFYASIIFAGIYLARYHVFDGATQKDEYLAEVAEAKAAVEAYKENAKGLIDANTVELLTGTEDINAGKAIFSGNCAACHKIDGGGGIGPNLTDSYWILGGGIKNVFNTISEGGRAGKGMVSWKTDLQPEEIAQVASYVLSLHSTTPLDPKEPEGELWVDPDARVDEVKVEAIDSASIEIEMSYEEE
ncbi:cbb3-type cytochrome c oxidase N-terminal domain-containing protein [Christiangramia sp. OXR-203]|jgi:cytochrome c oxidase cbb3-type subunit 3|uniref:cbb3-type cytochrome c oxidase N-terminal domain-containing protein n=1 Tax=Christiangramia sp. OXR-203 TaxID=3100176 RepID=UPI002AC9D4BE|nr:cbb3-type cytochrome c oxidase N-terminal domain-containing protein [Christiangramia sp. OXR-203]WPY98677.1 cbb3-type cytochrome c oxidase N-terminal domain-containing protein [Christiangramia sp. OXR-203]